MFYKESREKRHRMSNYFIYTAAYTARLYSLGGINLNSLKSRELTTYVRIYVFVCTRIESLDKLLT